MPERFVTLGLGRPRARWFADVTRWANSAALPLEFVKCVSAEEASVRLRSGRVWSAFLVDPTIPGVDRDLIQLARAKDAAVLAVSRDDTDVIRWLDLGASAVLPEPLDRQALADALDAAAAAVVDHTRVRAAPRSTTWSGALATVVGTAGAGTSTVAMGLAQGLAAQPSFLRSVLLADLALDADQGLLHDAGEVIPGVQELVEAHRTGTPDAADVIGLTFDVPERGYHLLLGLRRHRDWAALRPQALEESVSSLRRSFRLVVADTDADIEGRAECGSIEVEERNGMARTATTAADVVIVVTTPSPRGVRRLVRILADLVETGVDPGRLLPVVNRGPRSPRGRAQVAAALPDLLSATGLDTRAIGSPIFLPERRSLEETRPGPSRLPKQLTGPVTTATMALLDHASATPTSGSEPERVAPGSLGSFLHHDGSV